MFCIRHTCNRYHIFSHVLRRSYTRSGLQDERTKKVIEEIKQLEYQLQADIKKKENVFEKIGDEEIAAIYKELSAPIPTKPKISSDFLEKLSLRFLDTRSQQLPSNKVQQLLPSGSNTTNDITEQLTEQKASSSLSQNYTIKDFESLIYANSIAKRPAEAKKALELMQKYNIAPNVRSFNHLIDAYANANDLKHVISTFKKLKECGLKPDIYTYGSIIKAFVVNQRIDDAIVVFEKMKDHSIIPSQPIFANIISGCLKSGKVDKAWEIFDSMRLSYHQPDEVSYTLMLHACAKRGEVERALNLFEEMANYQLYPTDVTFNVLINACAKRADYYSEAFNLLEQMQEHYGFQPDKITFNTLLTACARKKDLAQARHILNTMWKDAEKKGTDSLLAPDSQTFTNLFWCYASYQPIKTSNTNAKETSKSTELVTKENLLPVELPRKRSNVIKEVRQLFKFATSSNIEMTTALLNAYLTAHISQKQTKACIDIYTKTFEKYNVQKDGFTFSQMLEYCYKNKDGELGWKVWEDYQTFLESRHQALDVSVDAGQGDVMEEKAKEAKREICAIQEGWTDEQQQKLSISMANMLARTNDIKNSLSIIATETCRVSKLDPPNLKDLMPVYNKCIQLEDDEARRELIRLCTRDKKRIGSLKYKRVNT
ncbi:hypothetical protein G6F47_004064 [Rhizopus delemar]|nr:hypothetical protein G6F54_000374 [Rhizopus delemar]KAG1516193.1 hypothetical protein G6F53_002347 [Rhizopus delemar]KAG1601020.1 hypothetical protein G6F47_004064 [Rhizopus delemar]